MESEGSVEVGCDHDFTLHRYLLQFSVDADAVQRDSENYIDAVFCVSHLCLQVSFLLVHIWLEPNVSLLNGALVSAGQAEKSFSVSFSFELQEDMRDRIGRAAKILKVFLHRELLTSFLQKFSDFPFPKTYP